MAAPARKQEPPRRLTLDEFMTWDDGTDTRYELIDGRPVAMNPPAYGHGLMQMNLGRAVGSQLTPPCRISAQTGVRSHVADDCWFEADLLITCHPPAARGHWVDAPVVIIEILSPSTADHDRGRKVSEYREIPTVQEIVLVSATAVRVERWRRSDGDWMVSDRIGLDSVLDLASVGVAVPLAAIYDGVSFDEPDQARP